MVEMEKWTIEKDSIFTLELPLVTETTIKVPATNIDCQCLNLKEPVKLLCYPFIKGDKVVDLMILQL